MRNPLSLLLVVVLCSVPAVAFCADQPPSPNAVLALADKYIKAREPLLKDKDKTTIGAIEATLDKNKNTPTFLNQSVDDLANQMTIALAGMKSFDALIVGSAYVVKYTPANPRAANLFGAVLHAGSEPVAASDPSTGATPTTTSPLDATQHQLLVDARVVVEYAVQLVPISTLALVNLANVYFDLNRDDDAKPLLDKAVFLDANCLAAHKALAFYWNRKHMDALYRAELLKAAEFKGFVQDAKDKQTKTTDEESVAPGDSLKTMETKLDELKDSVPLSTADVIEDDFPAQAKQIRDKYGKLAVEEKMELPKLPQVKVASNQDYAKSHPMIVQWVKSSDEKLKWFMGKSLGIDTTASKAVRKAQEAEIAKTTIAEGIAMGQQTAQLLKGMPGLTAEQQAKIQKAMQKALDVAQKKGVTLPPAPTTPPDSPGGTDSGGLFSASNWHAYQSFYNDYIAYFNAYWAKYDADLDDTTTVYLQKVDEENKYHDDELTRLQGQGNNDVPTKREMLRHKVKLNELGDDYYHKWANEYMPEYAQKMKPRAEEFWALCALYIKNMNDPAAVKREYQRVTEAYVLFSGRAISNILRGETFKYAGSTEEEEKALIAALQAAERAAEAKKSEFVQENRVPERTWLDWIGDHLVLEVSGQFLSFKLTARTIEFEAWVNGAMGRVKFDVVNGTMETYSGASAKFDVGVNVCGLAAKAEEKVEYVAGYSKWDFEQGTFSDSFQPTGKSTTKVGLGPAEVKGEVTVDAELHAKTASKFTYKGSKLIGFTVQKVSDRQ